MKEQIIQIPDTLEIKEIKDGKIILVEKEKKLTYEDIARELFHNKKGGCYITARGDILDNDWSSSASYKDANKCTSQKQAEKLLAINKLMNVAKYLNDGWQPDWNDEEEGKHYISLGHINNDLFIDCTRLFQDNSIYFKSEELAKQAIEILGEETIKLALCTDY